MSSFVILGLVLFGYMSLWYIISLMMRRNDVADVAWGLGFVLVAWISFILSDNWSARGMIIVALVSMWGLRLAWHIHARNTGKTEDYRYLAWRKEWGRWFYVRSYIQVYLLQGALVFFIAMPVFLIHANAGPDLGVLDVIGMLVWVIGFFFETLGDAQLARFIRNPAHAGQLMQSGLWAYTRHPNYFGEVTQWWGVWLIALAVPGGWMGIIGPMIITILILKVSGIPMLEKKMETHPTFAEYKRKTSVFIPMFPKR